MTHYNTTGMPLYDHKQTTKFSFFFNINGNMPTYNSNRQQQQHLKSRSAINHTYTLSNAKNNKQ